MKANPRCLRTLAQVITKFAPDDPMCANGDYAVMNHANCGPVHAEFCYNGSPAITSVLSVGTLILSVVTVFVFLF